MPSILQPRCALRRLTLALLLTFGGSALAADLLGAVGLRSKQAALEGQLADNPFGRRMVLQSQEAVRRSEGDVYAVLAYPFPVVSAALSDPGQWCDILILHLNNKYCRSGPGAGGARIDLRVGKKREEPIRSAALLSFDWRATAPAAEYIGVEMGAPDGPMDTSDYRMVAEAIPLDGGGTFLHLGYAFSFGGAGRLAMSIYLGSIARDKVGFTRLAARGDAAGDAAYVGGMRGVVERNTMRYYLAIESYLGSLRLPPQQQLDHRLAAWFDATERYPRQLHEVERDEYLRMKHNEVRRQNELR